MLRVPDNLLSNDNLRRKLGKVVLCAVLTTCNSFERSQLENSHA